MMEKLLNVKRILQAKVAHFLSLFRLFAKCTLFKCHKCTIKSLIWQNYLWIKIANLNKNIYWGWNSVNIHQSSNYGLLKWTYGLCYGFYINVQMHFLLWFHLKFFLIRIQYTIRDGKKYGLKKTTTKTLTNK
jgi:hypothetical protein